MYMCILYIVRFCSLNPPLRCALYWYRFVWWIKMTWWSSRHALWTPSDSRSALFTYMYMYMYSACVHWFSYMCTICVLSSLTLYALLLVFLALCVLHNVFVWLPFFPSYFYKLVCVYMYVHVVHVYMYMYVHKMYV